MPDYPEHDKLKKVNHLTQAIHEFTEWMEDTKNVHLATWIEGAGDFGMRTLSRSERDALMAEFYDIDPKKLEQEKQQIIDSLTAT